MTSQEAFRQHVLNMGWLEHSTGNRLLKDGTSYLYDLFKHPKGSVQSDEFSIATFPEYIILEHRDAVILRRRRGTTCMGTKTTQIKVLYADPGIFAQIEEFTSRIIL